MAESSDIWTTTLVEVVDDIKTTLARGVTEGIDLKLVLQRGPVSLNFPVIPGRFAVPRQGLEP